MNNKDSFFSFVCVSVVLHLLMGYLFLFGIPSLFNRLPEEQVITFELLPVDKISNVPARKVQKQEEIVNEDAKASKQSKARPIEEENLTKPELKTEPKAEQPKVEPEKIKPKETEVKKSKEDIKPKENLKPEEKKASKIKEQKPKSDVKPQKTPDQKPKTKDVKKKKKDSNLLDSILKDLEASSEGHNAKSSKHNRGEKTDNNIESQGKYNEDLELSISEADLIKQQIDRHWWRPTGVDLTGVKIILYIVFDKDGTVLQVKVKDKICNSLPDSTCRALADSATRAVLNASPIQNLDPKRYEIWKEVEELVFSP